jgi:hypothetical protein
MALAGVIATHLRLSEERQATYNEEVMMQEAVLGIHVLNIPFEVLPKVDRLPDVFERLGLTNARLPLLFTLGQIKAIYDEQYFSADTSLEDLQILFEQWQDQPAAKDITPYPVLIEGATSQLRSIILGSEVVLETPNNPTSFGIVESLLGAFEALLATSEEGDLMPHQERMTIVVRASEKMAGVPEIHFSEDDGSRVEIIHPIDFSFSTATDILNFRRWIEETIIVLLGRIFIIRDIQNWMAKIAGQEHAFSRALMLGDALTLDRNVFGNNPKFSLADWIEVEDKIYDQLRERPWRVSTASNETVAGPYQPPKSGVGPPPADLIDKSRLKHTERKTMSPIDVSLWDRAKWCGTLFGEAEGQPPFLGIIFENGKIGQSIFESWRERWKPEEADDALRVAIITGVSKLYPAHYAVVIGPNLNRVKDSGVKIFVTVSRINRMHPKSSFNLDRFLAAYQRFGGYFLIPVQNALEEAPPKPNYQLYLPKRQLEVRPAWQIGENDPDIMALKGDDDPILPPGVTDPPVKRALLRIRSKS